MRTELPKGTELFAGRYVIEGTEDNSDYGICYAATDREGDSRVSIQEFFPVEGCHRDAQTQNMSIRREKAGDVSAAYRRFTDYVSRLKERRIAGGQVLRHAFKDRGTAYYVTGTDDTAVLCRFMNPRPAVRPEPVRIPRQERPAESSDAPRILPVASAPRRTADEQSRVRESNYRNAVLWYRIIIVLLLLIVSLLVYLNFFTKSPKVMSAHPAPAVQTEAAAPDTGAGATKL